MTKLNLPACDFKIKSKENKHYIFDPLRKKDVVLTEEEWVRQHFVQFLIREKNYPKSLIAIEKQIRVENTVKRTDIMVFNNKGLPEVLVECKAPQVSISQDTFDQIARYNFALKADFLVVTNGMDHFFCQMDHENKVYRFHPDLPDYVR